MRNEKCEKTGKNCYNIIAYSVITIYICKKKEMKTTTRIKRIGNSRGVVIPSEILRELSLSERDCLDIRTEDGKIILSASSVEETFSGPFTGPFAELSGDPNLWGGPLSAVEYEDELRRGRHSVKEMETW